MSATTKPALERTSRRTSNSKPETVSACKSRRSRKMRPHRTRGVKLPASCSKHDKPKTETTSRNCPSNTQTRFIVDRRSCSSSFCYKNILASRGVPILFILVCFLVIANTNCDQAASTNGVDDKQKPAQAAPETATSNQNDRDEEPAEQQEAVSVHIKSSTSAPLRTKFDALNVLREIYFDGNSKLTMLLPDDAGTVQKFHPNGRYGRRSVDNFAERHDELGELVSENQLDSYEASGPVTNIVANDRANSLTAMLRTIGRDLDFAKARVKPSRGKLAGPMDGPIRLKQQFIEPGAPASRFELLEGRGASLINHQVEMSKLLRCNYSGVPKLYWCDTNRGALPDNRWG